MMETIYGKISNLHIHSAPNPDTYLAMTGNLLPVHGFEKIKKRHLAGQGFRYRNDIIGLGKQEDWHSRMSFFARRFKHYRPHLQEISGKKGCNCSRPRNIKIYPNRTEHAQPASVF